MSNKGKNYGLITKQDVEMRRFGGSALVNLDQLTRADVYTAIRALLAENSSFDELAIRTAAKKVKSVLRKKGFRTRLSVTNGNISDGSRVIQLTHSKYFGVSIITAHEK